MQLYLAFKPHTLHGYLIAIAFITTDLDYLSEIREVREISGKFLWFSASANLAASLKLLILC